MSNWGIGLGAAVGGFNTGLSIGSKLKGARSDMQAKELREKGMEEARQARELEINGAITSNGVMPTVESNQAAAASPSTAPTETSATPLAVASPEGQVQSRPLAPQGQPQAEAPAMTPQQMQSTAAEGGLPTFTVGGKVYTDPAKARSAAEKAATSTTDLFIKNSAEKMREHYIVNGDTETAEKWSKWAEDAKNKSGMKLWAGAYTAAQSGDWDKAADNFGKYYSKHIDDGVEYVGKKDVMGEDGKLIGFAVTLRDEKTGKEREMQLTPQAMLKMGMANNPQALFDSEMKKQAGVDAAKAKIAEENVKQRGRIELEGVKAGNALERVTTKAQLDQVKDNDKAARATAGTVKVLKDNGYTDDEVKKMIPAILKIGEHKKTTDPAERASIVASELTKSDPTFSRLSDEKKQEKILSVMKAADGAAKAITGKAGAPAAPAAEGGITPPSAANAGKLPVWDTKTGRMVYR